MTRIYEKRLEEAEEAYHLLVTGVKEVSVDVGGFGAVRYTRVNMGDLRRYIGELKAKLRRRGVFRATF